jgi:hypothetical protein
MRDAPLVEHALPLMQRLQTLLAQPELTEAELTEVQRGVEAVAALEKTVLSSTDTSLAPSRASAAKLQAQLTERLGVSLGLAQGLQAVVNGQRPLLRAQRFPWWKAVLLDGPAAAVVCGLAIKQGAPRAALLGVVPLTVVAAVVRRALSRTWDLLPDQLRLHESWFSEARDLRFSALRSVARSNNTLTFETNDGARTSLKTSRASELRDRLAVLTSPWLKALMPVAAGPSVVLDAVEGPPGRRGFVLLMTTGAFFLPLPGYDAALGALLAHQLPGEQTDDGEARSLPMQVEAAALLEPFAFLPEAAWSSLVAHLHEVAGTVWLPWSQLTPRVLGDRIELRAAGKASLSALHSYGGSKSPQLAARAKAVLRLAQP